eukprot:jgi/Mesen1/8302/ME000451S07505
MGDVSDHERRFREEERRFRAQVDEEVALNRARLQASSRDEEDEDFCRICRTPGDESNPLYYPCACSGSIKYVHQDCLLQWLNHSNTRSCEVCKHAFSFSPVYAENAPAQLPVGELVMGAALRVARGFHFVLRLALVLCVWLLFIPYCTCWLARLAFVRGISAAYSLFLSRCTSSLYLTDCVYGSFLSAAIVFVFLGATSLRDHLRHRREQAEELENDVGVGHVGQRFPEDIRPDERHRHAVLLPGEGGEANVPGEAGPLVQGQGFLPGVWHDQGADDVAARGQGNGPRGGLADFGNQDMEMGDPAEDLPFEELVGMQGPLINLFENAITVLVSNCVFLFLVLAVPFTLGRMSLAATAYLMPPAGGAGSSGMPGSLAPPAPEQLFSLASNTTLAQMLDSKTTWMGNSAALGDASRATWLPDGVLEPSEKGFCTVPAKEASSAPPAGIQGGEVGVLFAGDSESQGGANKAGSALLPGGVKGTGNATGSSSAVLQHNPALSDAVIVAIGYGVIIVAVATYVCGVLLIRYMRGGSSNDGVHGQIYSAAEAAPNAARQVVAGLRYVGVPIKVGGLLLVELGVFPLLCGWWLDVCTMGLFGATLQQRTAFLASMPLVSVFLHWFVGITYMLQVSIFVGLLREVLRHGVLAFLRDPADPNYNPFRDLIDDPLPKHARRVLLSVVVYGNLIVMLIYAPARLALALSPSMFPLNWRFSDPFAEISADMLLFHVCVPFTIEHFRPRSTLKRVLRLWVSSVGTALGLAEYLLPPPDGTHAAANDRGLPGGGNDLGRQLLLGPPPPPPMAPLPAPGMAQEGPAEAESEAKTGQSERGRDDEDFAVRIALLLLAAWTTLLVFNTSMTVVPVLIGRAVFGWFTRLPFTQGAQCNDVYAFGIGCYVLWGALAGVRYAAGYLRTHDVSVLAAQIFKWACIVAKSAALLSLWIGVVPVLLGLLFELLLLIPLRVPVDESPVILLYQDWAFGLVFLKVWTRLVMMGQADLIVNDTWRRKLERVRADGFANLHALWVLRNIIVPVLVNLLTALCVPFVLARGLVPLLGFPLLVESAVYRFAWIGSLALTLAWYGICRAHKWVLELHNTIRDDRYLVGRRLHNFGPVKPRVDTNRALFQSAAGGAAAADDESYEEANSELSGQESDWYHSSLEDNGDSEEARASGQSSGESLIRVDGSVSWRGGSSSRGVGADRQVGDGSLGN